MQNLFKIYLLWLILISTYISYAQKPDLLIQSGHSNTITCLKFSPNNKFICSASKDGLVVLWNFVNGKQFLRFGEQKTIVTDIAFHPSKTIIASAGIDGVLLVWDYITGAILQKYTIPDSSISSVEF